jgi:phytoene dehydrogenase-like protein
MSQTLKNKYDCIIIGSGPNGLSAGIYLAQKGLRTLIVEARNTAGGGMRTSELTLPGIQHDVCSAVHPMGFLSPWFRELELEKYGLSWAFPEISVAHPLDDEPAALLSLSLEDTAFNLGIDSKNYKKLMSPFVERGHDLIKDCMKPLCIPNSPLLMAQFGVKGIQSANHFSRNTFQCSRAKALFAGCVAHSTLPFDKLFTTAFGILFLTAGHLVNWPVAVGGSESIAKALLKCFQSAGGEIKLCTHVKSLEDLPASKTFIFDTDPIQMADICGSKLSSKYSHSLKSFRFGPGVYKIDYALSEPIPWKDKNCLKASTVHLGGTIEEIAFSEQETWNGIHSNRPFVIVAQQSLFDRSRGPENKHTCWAYCHVPHGSTKDMHEIIENQIERFAPGFKDTILAKHVMTTSELSVYNPNYVGGTISGGAADIYQLFTRPVDLFNPYRTSNEKIYICSASSPPGGGVHGMNGYNAARSLFKHHFR